MKAIKTLSAVICALAILAGPAFAGEGKDKTCCEKAKAAGKECTHKCCVAAHKDGKSCEKCNKNKEDVKKEDKKAEKKAN
jgi:hypothetical protein